MTGTQGTVGLQSEALNVQLPEDRSLLEGASLLAAVPDMSVKDQIALSDAAIRRAAAVWIMVLFGIVNIFMLGFIVWLAWMDHAEILQGLAKPADRLVNPEVVIALLGATTVQLGAIAVIMVKFLFGPTVDGA